MTDILDFMIIYCFMVKHSVCIGNFSKVKAVFQKEKLIC